jgi:hypothetical protein
MKSITKVPGEASLNIMEGGYKKGAVNRGIEWSLTKEEFREIISRPCFWCGIEPGLRNMYNKPKERNKVTDFTYNRSWIKANGIDRVNSDDGYNSKNCVAACTECNFAKSDRTAKEFFEHCKRVADYLAKKFNII